MSDIVAVANARIPGHRAHSIQIVKSASALARAGADVELLIPRRSGTGGRAPRAAELESFYGVSESPPVRRLWSFDTIDWWPPALQKPSFLLQTSSFAAATRRHLDRCRWRRLYLRDPHSLYLLARHRRPWLRYVTYEAHGLPKAASSRRRLASVLPEVGRVIALNDHLARGCRELGVNEDRIRVEPAAAVGDGRPPMTRQAARASLGLPPSDAILCYTGSLTSAKGVDTLIRAADQLPGSWSLLLVGGDARQRRWAESRRATDGRVGIVGQVTPAEVASYLAAADVLVLPNSAFDEAASRWTSPMKLFEAAGAGRPVVVSDVPALREAVAALPDGAAIEWCTADDVESLAGAVVRARARANEAHAPDDDGWRTRALRILDHLPEGRVS